MILILYNIKLLQTIKKYFIIYNVDNNTKVQYNIQHKKWYYKNNFLGGKKMTNGEVVLSLVDYSKEFIQKYQNPKPHY